MTFPQAATCGRNISGKLLFIAVCTIYRTRLYNESIARDSITVRIAFFCSLKIGNRCGNRTELQYLSLAQQRCLQQQQSVAHPEDGGTWFFRALENVYQTPLSHRDFAIHLCENLRARPPRTYTAFCKQWKWPLPNPFGPYEHAACGQATNSVHICKCDLPLCTQCYTHRSWLNAQENITSNIKGRTQTKGVQD